MEDGITFKVSFSMQIETEAVRCSNTLVLVYQSARGYILECKVEM
jgi:hypothetical protein